MRTAVLLLVLALAGCGGGLHIDLGSYDDDDGPTPSGRSGSLTVSAATDPVLNGAYASTDVELGDVERFNAPDPALDICRFRFAGLRQSGSTRELSGTVTYAPTSTAGRGNEMRSIVVALARDEYIVEGNGAGSVDAAGSRILVAGATLTTAFGPVMRITLAGEIPMRASRPAGC